MFALQNSCFSPKDVEECTINDRQMGQYLVNMLDGASFPTETATPFGMLFLFYVAEHRSHGPSFSS